MQNNTKKPIKKKKVVKKKTEEGYPTWSDYPDAQELPGGMFNPENWDPYGGHTP